MYVYKVSVFIYVNFVNIFFNLVQRMSCSVCFFKSCIVAASFFFLSRRQKTLSISITARKYVADTVVIVKDLHKELYRLFPETRVEILHDTYFTQFLYYQQHVDQHTSSESLQDPDSKGRPKDIFKTSKRQ